MANVRFNSGVDDRLTTELYLNALEGAVRDGDGNLAARCTANLASVYTRLGDLPEALHYHTMAMELSAVTFLS